MTIEYKDSKRIVGLESDKTTTEITGYDGGSGITSSRGGGGGGGAGAVGGDAQGNFNPAGDGGIGKQSDIIGTNTYYAGGGGGGRDYDAYANSRVGYGGSGGGGNGQIAGTANTGGGGGGGSGNGGSYTEAGIGGSGVVILQFTTSGTSYSTTGSPTVDTSSVSGKTILKYTGSGTFVLTGGTPDVRYLVVAGGGGGHTSAVEKRATGGGGAGGFRTGTKSSMANSTYTVTVGGGGAVSNNGSNSVFSDITSTGGGAGALNSVGNGSDGGSGGGGGEFAASDGSYGNGGSGTTLTYANPSMPTDIQDNSLLVEKDTARRYWFDAESARTPTFEDDFSSDNWTDVGTQMGVSGGKMAWNALRNGSNQGSYYDIGTANISETEWILDFTLDIDAMTEGSANAYFTIGLSDTATMNVNTSQDHIGLLTYLDTSSGGNSRFMAQGVNGGVLTSGTDFTTADPQTLGLYYLRIRRTSATECKVAIYSDSDYSTLVEEETVTITSGLSGLRYLKLTNLTVSGAGTGVFNGTMDNVKFYNGVTSTTTPATWTMQPTFQDDFSSDNWTDSGSNVDISSGVMNFDIGRTTTDQSSYYQLSSALSDTKWVVRLHDVIVTTKSGGVEVFIGVSSNTSGAQTAQDFIGLNLGDNTANPVLGGVDSDGAVIARLAGDYTYSLSTTYNIEIIRESATSYRIKVFSNSGFDSTALFSQSYTCTATTTGLQYVKFANGQVAGSTENIIGTCSKIEIYNGVSTIN